MKHKKLKMKYLRLFESDDFEIGKKEVSLKLQELIDIYEDFSNDISPKHWRLTGHHITELRKMLDELKGVTEITPEEKEIDWVKKERFKK